MKVLVSSKISPHRYKTPEGYLVCTDCILSRTGKQTYRKNEVFADSDDESEIEVDRTEDEVFSNEALASFENKPLTIEHPDEDVNVGNYKEYAVGYVRDIRRGEDNGKPVMMGNIVITDEEAISDVENHKLEELSCGYDCDIEDEQNPQQRNIRGNHVALCERGRAGNARIVDSVKDDAFIVPNWIKSAYVEAKRKTGSTDIFKIAKYINENISTYDYNDLKRLLVMEAKNRGDIVDSIKDSFKIKVDLGFRVQTEEYDNQQEADERYDELLKLQKKPSMKGMKIEKLYDSVEDADERYYNILKNIAEKYNIAKTAQSNAHTTKSDLRYMNKKLEASSDLRSSLTKEWNDIVKTFSPTYQQVLGKEPSMKKVEEFFKMTKGEMKKNDMNDGRIEEKLKREVKKRFEEEKSSSDKSSKITENGLAFEIIRENGKKLTYRAGEGFTVDSVDDSEIIYKGIKITEEHGLGWQHYIVHSPRGNFIYLSLEGAKKDIANKAKELFGDSVNDRLIEIPQQYISKFEDLLRRYNVKIERKGKTHLGNVHYQVLFWGTDKDLFSRLGYINNEMGLMGIRMAYSANNVASAGIDLLEKSVKDMEDALSESDMEMIDEAIYYAKKNGNMTISGVLDVLNKDVAGFVGTNEKDIVDYLKKKGIKDSKKVRLLKTKDKLFLVKKK